MDDIPQPILNVVVGEKLLGMPSRCQLLQRNDIKSGVSLKLVGDVAVSEDFVTHSTRCKSMSCHYLGRRPDKVLSPLPEVLPD